jgi:hypothetical protein
MNISIYLIIFCFLSVYLSIYPPIKTPVTACFMLVSLVVYSSTLRTEATYSSETSIDIHAATQRYIPQDTVDLFITTTVRIWNPEVWFLLHFCPLSKNEVWPISEYICRVIMTQLYFNSIHKAEVSDKVWTWGELVLALWCHLLSNAVSTAAPLADGMTRRRGGEG